MKEVVINSCFGGFSLSDIAFERYLELKKVKYYKYPSLFGMGSDYYNVPKEKYDKLLEKCKLTGSYKKINDKNWFLNDRDIPRDDKDLVAVVKEFGDKANGMCASLKIIKIPDGIEWEIDEYDGSESVEEVHRSWS